MTDFDPAALRSLAARAARSPRGVFPGMGLAVFSGAYRAALKWALDEDHYIAGARAVGVAESDAKAVLDEVVAERHAWGMTVACEDTFRAARNRLYSFEWAEER